MNSLQKLKTTIRQHTQLPAFRRIGIAFALLVCFLPGFLNAQQSSGADSARFDKLLDAALTSIASKHHQRLILSIGSFTYEQSGIPGPFAQWLGDRIASSVSRLSDRIDYYVHNAADGMGGEFREVFGDFISEKGVRQVIRGKYYDRNDRVLVSFEVVDFLTGLMVGKEDVEVMKTVLPRSVGLVPINFDTAVNVMRDLGDILAGRQGGFSIGVTTTKGNGAMYREGEAFTITIAANRDCYIKVYHVNVKGELKLIFPETGYSNFLKARTLYTIPDAEYPVDFIVEPPFGTESLKVVAATEQFAVIEPCFTPLGTAKKEYLSMDIGAKRRNPNSIEVLTAEAYAVYTTVPK